MTVSDTNKAVVRACFETGMKGHLDALDTIIDPAFVLHDPASPEDIRGLEAFKALVKAYRAGLPDLQIAIDQQLTDGDYVATRWTARGTHTGELMGVPASGRPVTLAGVTISRCHDGRIVEEWEISDTLGLLRQVGALPDQPEP